MHGVYVVACLSHFIICTVKYFPNYDFQVFWLKVHIMQKGPPSWQFLLWPYNMYCITKQRVSFTSFVSFFSLKSVRWINLILDVLSNISLKHKFVTPRSLDLCYLVTHPFLCTKLSNILPQYPLPSPPGFNIVEYMWLSEVYGSLWSCLIPCIASNVTNVSSKIHYQNNIITFHCN